MDLGLKRTTPGKKYYIWAIHSIFVCFCTISNQEKLVYFENVVLFIWPYLLTGSQETIVKSKHLPNVGGEETSTHQAPVHGAGGQEVTSNTVPLGPPGRLHSLHGSVI